MSKLKSSTLTRRQFLRRVAAVGGYAATYQAMAGLGLLTTQAGCGSSSHALAVADGNGKHVVILGAGIAGMSAAYELSQRGYTCSILEACNRVGGRNQTARHGTVFQEIDQHNTCTFDDAPHFYANMGPARLPHHHHYILQYCRDFNIALEIFSNDNRAAFFHHRNAFGGTPVMSKRLMADSRGALAELLSKAIQRHALDEEITAMDHERLLSYLKNFGDLNDNYAYAGSTRAGPGFQNDPLSFSEILTSDFWEYKMHFAEGMEQSATMMQPVGGMDKIVDAFYSRVQHMVNLEMEVTMIRNTTTGVEVAYTNLRTGEQNVAMGDYCICTVPLTVLRDIPNNFSSAFVDAMRDVTYDKAGKAAFQSTRFWEHAGIYGGISWTDQDITQMWYPNSNFHAEQGIIVGAYIWDDEPGLRFASQTHAQRIETCKLQGEALHEGYSRYVHNGITISWQNMPYQKGSWRTDLCEVPAILHQPDGHVYLAGEHMSNMPGWQEGSIVSVRGVMEAIGQRVAAL